MRIAFALTLVLSLGSAEQLEAQIPTVPSSLGDSVKTPNTPAELEELTRLHNEGSWKDLQVKAAEMVGRVPVAPFISQGVKNHVVLLWPGQDAAGESALLWILVRDPRPEAYSTVLPGLKGRQRGLYEIYLSPQEGAGFTSYYISTAVEDPFVSQLPTVVERIAEPLFALFGGAAGVLPPRMLPPRPPAPAPRPSVFAWIRYVPLPMARADVKAHYFAAEPIPLADFKKSADQLATRLRFTTASHSERARALASTLAQAAGEVSEKSCPAPTAADDATARRAKSAACMNALDERFLTEYKAAASPSTTEVEAEALRLVNRDFRDLVVNWRPEKTKAETTFQNRPLTHFGFGALTSFAFTGRTNEPRAKVNDGVVVEDPLPRTLTNVVLNYSIFGYNATSSRVGLRERVNLFGGTTIAPDFGLTGGLSFVLVRGLGFNIGYARLFHTTKQADDAFGQAPSDANDPLRVATVGVWFAGLSYNFK